MPRFSNINLLKWHKKVLVIFVTLTVAASKDSNCSSNPCMYGICVDDPYSSYKCYCIDGYTGINCEINWDDCWSSPCLNGGTCNDAIASYNCTCPEGYVGLTCEQKYSECMNYPCLNNGTCLDYNGFTCQCLEGFSGEFCEIDASVCNNTICKNSGECVEGPGLSFTCHCQEGWTGKFCGEDINECITLPCQNGGLCINMPGTYMCACLFGFNGKDCEKNVIPCEKNPCQNNAVCLFEDAQPICYCVPDYHGTLCELKYDDCESKYAHCENGGTCIDGINNFTCSCPSQYVGNMCTILLDTATTQTSVNFPENYTIETFDSTEVPTILNISKDFTTITIESTDSFEVIVTTEEDLYSTFQSNNTEKSLDTTHFNDVKEGFTVPIESRTEYDLDTFTTIKQDYATATEAKTTIFSVAENLTDDTVEKMNSISTYTTESMPEMYSPRTSQSSIFTTTVGSTFVTKSTIQSMSSSEAQQSSTTIGDNTLATSSNSDTWSPTSIFESTFNITLADSTLMTKTTTPIIASSTKNAIDADYDETMTNNSTIFSLTDKAISSVTTSSVVTMMPSTVLSSLNVTQSTFEGSIFPSSPDSETSTLSEVLTIATTVDDVNFTTFTDFYKTTFGIDIDANQMTHIPTTATTTTTTAATITEHKRTHNCTVDQCVNTSLCLFNATLCDCSYRNNCKKYPDIESAAFNGKSYIRQKFIIENGTLSIFVRLKTKAKNGILIHSLFDDERYALLYMEMGQLKFQFSCGLQTMLFGELDSPINSGQEVDLEMRFQYIVEDVSDKCSARLYVNGSVVMSGEQVLQTHESIPQFARLHLGGIPVAFSHQFPQIVLGFIGCMSLLRVNDIKRDFIHDAIEAVQIEECNSFLCLSNPCKNFGACEEMNGKIHCKCATGYSGDTCQRSICDDSPCHLGATCLTSPGVSFICICPLGTHGLFCEKDTTVVQPSFSVFAPGFSSYMAYGISSSLKNNMELRLRIIPQTLEQISLIAYMGQTGSKKESSDHFSITYVRGYIMLSWDLGSGVRRIFTNSPLSTRAHKVHTLQIGRKGRDSWLYVEGIGNVTGRAAGTNTRLDVSPILYIGGHKSKYFQTLPHDLPLHTGFSGCIYDIELRTDDNVFPVALTSPATGRGIGECYRNECSHHTCKNGAVCLNYGPTYSCICMKDWEGPDCSKLINCTTLNPLCHKPSQ